MQLAWASLVSRSHTSLCLKPKFWRGRLCRLAPPLQPRCTVFLSGGFRKVAVLPEIPKVSSSAEFQKDVISSLELTGPLRVSSKRCPSIHQCCGGVLSLSVWQGDVLLNQADGPRCHVEAGSPCLACRVRTGRQAVRESTAARPSGRCYLHRGSIVILPWHLHRLKLFSVSRFSAPWLHLAQVEV